MWVPGRPQSKCAGERHWCWSPSSSQSSISPVVVQHGRLGPQAERPVWLWHLFTEGLGEPPKWNLAFYISSLVGLGILCFSLTKSHGEINPVFMKQIFVRVLYFLTNIIRTSKWLIIESSSCPRGHWGCIHLKLANSPWHILSFICSGLPSQDARFSCLLLWADIFSSL